MDTEISTYMITEEPYYAAQGNEIEIFEAAYKNGNDYWLYFTPTESDSWAIDPIKGDPVPTSLYATESSANTPPTAVQFWVIGGGSPGPTLAEASTTTTTTSAPTTTTTSTTTTSTPIRTTPPWC